MGAKHANRNLATVLYRQAPLIDLRSLAKDTIGLKSMEIQTSAPNPQTHRKHMMPTTVTPKSNSRPENMMDPQPPKKLPPRIAIFPKHYQHEVVLKIPRCRQAFPRTRPPGWALAPRATRSTSRRSCSDRTRVRTRHRYRCFYIGDKSAQMPKSACTHTWIHGYMGAWIQG